MKKKSPESAPASKKLDSKALKAEVARLMIRSPKKLYSARQIIKRLDINNTKDSVEQSLVVLKEEGLLEKLNDGRYVLKDKNAQTRKKTLKTYEGTVDMTRTGAGFIKCPDLKEDVYVPAKFLNGALNRDKVSIEVFHMTNRRRPEGQARHTASLTFRPKDLRYDRQFQRPAQCGFQCRLHLRGARLGVRRGVTDQWQPLSAPCASPRCRQWRLGYGLHHP